jgi:hypothetical protein
MWLWSSGKMSRLELEVHGSNPAYIHFFEAFFTLFVHLQHFNEIHMLYK